MDDASLNDVSAQTARGDGAGGASALMGLFTPPPDEETLRTEQHSRSETAINAGQSTTKSEAGITGGVHRMDPLLSIEKPSVANRERLQTETHSNVRKQQPSHSQASASTQPPLPPSEGLSSLFKPPPSTDNAAATERTPLVSAEPPQEQQETFLTPIFPNSPTTSSKAKPKKETKPRMHCLSVIRSKVAGFGSEFLQPSTWVGAFMFLLYHTVYCLTMGSTLTRPSMGAGNNLLGLIAKLAAGGVIFGSPIYWMLIGEIPALYATADLFAAPFFAAMARKIDATLAADPHIQTLSATETDFVFLGSFSAVAFVAILLSGTFVLLASVFKLANVGSFLPFPVLAGFFGAVSVMTWELAFRIDSNGTSPSEVFFSGNWSMIFNSLFHHALSVATAAVMMALGPSHPFFLVGLVATIVLLFYLAMAVFGITRDEAVQAGWFWDTADLVYEPLNAPIGLEEWIQPAPFGYLSAIFRHGYIHWGAVLSGLEMALALAFLFLIRSSLHCPALRKNVTNLSRPEKQHPTSPPASPVIGESGGSSPSRVSLRSLRNRRMSEKKSEWDLEEDGEGHDENSMAVVSAKAPKYSLKEIMAAYGWAAIGCAVLGFLFITPNISTSSTMYRVRAEKVAPQFGACMLLLGFYLSDFHIVGYIPRTVFSAMLVLACANMFIPFVIKSFNRSREKIEWFVVPIILIMAFVIGLLGAVFLGIAMSTFFFVASFFRSGVVKFMASGTRIRSTIERSPQSALWLDEHGGLIQLLVLQNYLFFGNASSILSYVGSMFEEPEFVDPALLPPIPQIVILDLTLVSGIDTSAVDILSEILSVCSSHECKLFVAGASSTLRKSMELGGFRSTGKRSANRKLLFFADLDNAVGKAEDELLRNVVFADQSRSEKKGISGFRVALEHIDRQHHLDSITQISGLEPFTQRLSVEPGQILYDDIDLDRGLFFIEEGLMKVEQSAHNTVTRSGNLTSLAGYADHLQSLNAMKARASSQFDLSAQAHLDERQFRVARVGPGWILGVGESLTGHANPGNYIAVKRCAVHYISYQHVQELEESQPKLALKLEKLLAFLMAKRQSSTISQLATLHSIMSSPGYRRPVPRNQLSM